MSRKISTLHDLNRKPRDIFTTAIFAFENEEWLTRFTNLQVTLNATIGATHQQLMTYAAAINRIRELSDDDLEDAAAENFM